MEGLEEQLGAILNNPQMMSSLMQMAQSLSASQPPAPEAPQPQNPISDLGIDMGMLQKIATMAQSSNIDAQQRNLLSALTPYLHKDRISRLEKAMRAARLARFATSALSGR